MHASSIMVRCVARSTRRMTPLFPAAATMKWSEGSSRRGGRWKRARMSSTGSTRPRTLTTPSMAAGALGRGVMATARTSSRTSSLGRPYFWPATSKTRTSSELPATAANVFDSLRWSGGGKRGRDLENALLKTTWGLYPSLCNPAQSPNRLETGYRRPRKVESPGSEHPLRRKRARITRGRRSLAPDGMGAAELPARALPGHPPPRPHPSLPAVRRGAARVRGVLRAHAVLPEERRGLRRDRHDGRVPGRRPGRPAGHGRLWDEDREGVRRPR